MITAIDPAATTGVGTQVPAENYQTPRPRDVVARDSVLPGGTAADKAADTSAGTAERVASRVPGARSETALRQQRPSAKGGDQAEINFQMSREEREVFLSVMTGREKASEMSETEQKLMEKASERLDKLIEAATSRDTASRERMDKAVKEWYLRLSNGKQPPANLLNLITQAANGELD